MDWWLIFLRVAHVGAAMIWFGGAIINSVFLAPTADALGGKAQLFMDHLMNRRRMGIFFPVAAAVTVFAGLTLYWRDSGGFASAWIRTPHGLGYTIGGLAALVSFVLGFVLVAPGVAEQTAVRNELAATGGQPTPEQQQRLERADQRMRLANQIDLPLLLTAGLLMAVARYL